MLKPAAPQSGFTLVEIMISLVVLGVLIALAAPSFSSWLQNQQIRAAAEATLNGLQLARAEAVRRNAQVRFQFVSDLTSSCTLVTSSTDRINWVVSLGDPTGACNVTVNAAPPGPVIQSRAAEEGSPNVQVVITPGGSPAPTAVTFSPLGSVVSTNSDGSVAFTRLDLDNPAITGGAARPLRIVISAGGSARMCDPAVATAGDPRVCP
jgi:type IV fimbrial biogenesis protein FimT